VLLHYYGIDGRDSRKVDTKSLAFDYNLFEQMTQQSFVDNLQHKLNAFVEHLITTKVSGINKILNVCNYV
jgi:hypothetical protein